MKPACLRRNLLVSLGISLVFLSHIINDRVLLSAMVFYATPWPILLVGALLSFMLLRGWWKLAALPSLVVGLFALSASFGGFSSAASSTPAVRAATWNAARDLSHHPEAWSFDEDIVVIIEAGDMTGVWQEFLAVNPTHQWRRLETGILLGVKGEIHSTMNRSKHDHYRCIQAEVSTASGGRMDVIAVDIRSQPWLSKKEAMEVIFKEAPRDLPTLIMGDFNTPHESWTMRKAAGDRFHGSGEAPHRGLRETWPAALPLLAIDHIWASDGILMKSSTREYRGSDHLLLAVEIQVPSPPGPTFPAPDAPSPDDLGNPPGMPSPIR